ncbi:SDR family oxidoreductase [Acuticoccus sp. I52.16.1]|uniref:SDR family oxidoreductase n=1 Tax=Acuticoccus sp. I52.16.1 TaxID=2928472 RepID=UPI001FD54AFF|nr:SDR family oxidoreductase [Acuticoccus sp. I52.16.1]UOM35291.1 SDR family oxidoreductase [Acuticoccus sp. I52.16.1]
MIETAPVAIVTGASRGIGAAIAQRLALDGLAVAVNYAHNAGDAAHVVDTIVASGGRAVAVRADIADPGAVRRLFEETEAAFGPVGVLVNNAGVMRLAPIAETDDATIEAHLAINLRGPFYALREAARRMGPGGRIINLSSSAVGKYQPTYGAYAATKGAIEALSRVMANEMRGRDVTVNVVVPGPSEAEIVGAHRPGALGDTIGGRAPRERAGTPEEIADSVAFLAGPEGRWVNGQVLRINGGAA